MYSHLFSNQSKFNYSGDLKNLKDKNQFWFGSKYLGTSAKVGFNV